MKKIFLLFVNVALICTFISCTDDTSGSDSANTLPGVLSIDKSEVSFINLFHAEVIVTSLNSKGEPESFTATSLNEDIAFVIQQDDRAYIFAPHEAVGETQIIFTSETSTEELTCDVTVISSEPNVYEGTDFNSVDFPGVHLFNQQVENDAVNYDVATDYNSDGSFSKVENYYQYDASIETYGSWTYEYDPTTRVASLITEGDTKIYQKNMAGVNEVISESKFREVIENVFIVDGKLFFQGFLRTEGSEELIYIGSFVNNYKQTEPDAFGPGLELVNQNYNYELIISLDEYGQFLLTQNYDNESHQLNEQSGQYELVKDEPFTQTFPLSLVINQLSIKTFVSYEGNYYWFPFPDNVTNLETE